MITRTPLFSSPMAKILLSHELANMFLNIGSYMSAHVLLNLLNELRKRDKMRGLLNILSLFRNEFNKIQ